MTTPAEIAARYGAIVHPGLTVQVIPRGVSGLPDPAAPNDHWREMQRKATSAQVKALYLGRRLAAADARAAKVKASPESLDDDANRAQLFAEIAVKVAKPPKVKKDPAAPRNYPLSNPVTRERAIAARVYCAKATGEKNADLLRAQIASGMTAAEIAEVRRITAGGLRKLAARHGITLPPEWVIDGQVFANGRLAQGYLRKKAAAERSAAAMAGRGEKPKKLNRDPEILEAVRQAFDDGLSQPDTARLIGASATTVFRIQQQLGLTGGPRSVVVKGALVRVRGSALTDDVRAKAAEMFKGGMSDAKIGVALGISRSMAQRARQSMGVYGAAPHETETHRAIMDQRRAGLSMNAIAAALGVAKSTVWRIAARMDQEGQECR